MSNSTSISDDQALEALLSSAQHNEALKERENKSHNRNHKSHNDDDNNQRKRSSYGNHYDNYRNYSNSNNNNNYYNDNRTKRSRRWDKREEEKEDSKYQWGGSNTNATTTTTKQQNNNDNYYGPDTSNKINTTKDKYETNEDSNNVNNDHKEKPNFGLSGALAEDDKTGNTYNGIVLKFTEPPEARTPNTRWRLYVFKKRGGGRGDDAKKHDELIDTLHISKQSAYLFGRERKVADIPVDHPSLSKQHCVLQYRALPDKKDGRLICKPYLMDLGSTNGTFINGVRIDDARYYELRKGDVIRIGASSREYVLLTENTTSSDF